MSCVRPMVNKWLKQGVRGDITLSPPEVSIEHNEGGDGVSCARPLVYEWLKQGSGRTSLSVLLR